MLKTTPYERLITKKSATRVPFRLPTPCSVFHAEIAAVEDSLQTKTKQKEFLRLSNHQSHAESYHR